jgi:Tfp pilus assembly protein PilF
VNRVEIDYYLPYLYGMSHLSAIEGKPDHAEIAKDVATKILAMDSVTAEEKGNIAYQLALIDLQLQDTQGALAALDQAVDYNPKHLAALLAKCDVLLQSGQPDEVERAYARAVEQFPEEPLVFNNRGMFLQSLGRYDEAIADFDRAIEINKEFVPAYTNRAFARLQAGQVSQALADLTQSLEINPQQPAAYSLRGTANLQTGKAAAAIEDYQTALGMDENSPALRADVGFAQFFAGRYEDALASFNSALEVDPQAEFLNPWRAAALLTLDRRDDAEREFAAIVAKPNDQRTWYDVLTLLLLGKVNDNDVLSAISGADPRQEDGQKCEAFYFIGQRWLLEGKEEDAQTYFRQALESKSKHLSAYRGAQFALGDFGPEV